MLATRRIGLALLIALSLPLSAPAADWQKYLHDGTDGVITFNVRQFLDSPLIKKAGLDKALAKDDQAQAILKELGLDPLKDVERIIFGGGAEEASLVVVQGKFDATRFHAKAEAAAKEHKEILEIHKVTGGPLYELRNLDGLIPGLPPQAAGQVKGKSVFVVVADGANVVIAFTKQTALEVLDKAAGRKTTQLKNKQAAALISKINGKQTLAVAMPGQASGAEKLQSVTGGVTLTADLTLDVSIAMEDAAAATQLKDLIKEQLDRAQAFAAAIAPAKEALDALKIETKDKNVLMTGTIKGDTLERLVKALAALADPGSP
jgi:hypothetical protein